MADSAESASQLLDQLQNGVNRVIEQMGRVFVAHNENPKVAPTVQTHKLAQMLPSATDNFHTALDQLERELQLAKLVMRRDLAVCRERSGIAKPTHVNGTAVSALDAAKQQSETAMAATIQHDESDKPVEDTPMQDAQPDDDVKLDDATAEQPAQEQQSSDAIEADDKTAKESDVPASAPEATADNTKAADSTLQIDTNAQSKNATGEGPQGEDDNPPDTGTFSNTNDLDSLFGGPTSADPVDGGDFNNDTDFDFGSFGANLGDNGADNDDNIISLLPGLQDYANNQAGDNATTDFDNLFDFDNVPMDTQQNENTFDDLLDFEDFTGGNDDGNNANGGDTDFNFSFD